MNRRDLLKLFGTGATIAPVLGGIASESARAIIVEPPKVELAPSPQIMEVDPGELRELLCNLDQYDVTVHLRAKRTGKVLRMDCEGFVTSISHDAPIYVSSIYSAVPYPTLIPGVRSTVTLELSGPMRMVKGQ